VGRYTPDREHELDVSCVNCQNSRMSDAREVLTWEQFGEAARDLARTVWESGYEPAIVVCVARGGLIPAGAIAYALDHKSLLVLNVEFYTGIGTTLLDPRLVDPVPELKGLQDKRVLIVDDVADSGRTLQFVKGICAEYTDSIKVAVLYQKSSSVVDADYVWKHTDQWIAFPWSSQPPVTGSKNKDN
jgi:hypoxanthine phosphoribosyltransferase